MGQNLVIVESPAKAKTISKYLGKNYIVEASMGHVRDLPKSKLGVDIEDNFTTKYITIRGKGELIDKLRKAAKKADKIIGKLKEHSENMRGVNSAFSSKRDCCMLTTEKRSR